MKKTLLACVLAASLCGSCKIQTASLPQAQIGNLDLEPAASKVAYRISKSVEGTASGGSALLGLLNWGDDGYYIRLPLIADVLEWLPGVKIAQRTPGVDAALNKAIASDPEADSMIYPRVSHLKNDMVFFAEWHTTVQGKSIIVENVSR
jgi:hypothetical protein